jgi:hypothetical protein
MKREEDRERWLAGALAELKSGGIPDAPQEIERNVMAAFDRRARTARGYGWMVPSLAAAASLAVIGGVALYRGARPAQAETEPFVAIPYTAPLAPYERAVIRQMDVPVAALIAAGFEIEARDTSASLRADVLFGQDGRAHAIRVIHNNDRRISQ